MHTSLVGDLLYFCGPESMSDTEKEDQGSPMKYPNSLRFAHATETLCS